ncbi:unnamed protein product [Parnassius mnemosyne]|uniref:HTH CENPB-type domain-containing protein n=1 Tax=Parnassius mnemosyne TaxID=213953 RepID=A0AAV1L1D5_9NEOP
MPPTKILQYDEEVMTKALDDVMRGVPVYAVAKKYKIPRSTLRSKVKGINPISRKMGARTAFTADEELKIEEWVLELARKGFPVSKGTFLISLQRLAAQLGKDIFRDRVPSKKWYGSFMSRHPRISNRVAQNLTKSRSSITNEQLDGWKNDVYTYLEGNGLASVLDDPKRVFNADETAFFLQPKAGKVMAERGCKNIYQAVGNDEKECITVLFTGNANRDLAPPLVVFRYTRIPLHITVNVPTSWAIGKSEQGWMTCAIFYEYIGNQFIPWLEKEKIVRPVLFFVDGHVSHLSMEVSQLCSQNDIVLVALYPNATHLLQPMDVSVFHTLKASWKEKALQHRLSGGEVSKSNFCALLDQLLLDVYRPEILANGFKKCGLVPWNPLEVTVRPAAPPKATEPNTETNLCCPNCIPWLKTVIGAEKIASFSGNKDSIPVTDHSLYELWKKVTTGLEKNTVTILEASLANAEDPVEDGMEIPAPLDPVEDGMEIPVPLEVSVPLDTVEDGMEVPAPLEVSAPLDPVEDGMEIPVPLEVSVPLDTVEDGMEVPAPLEVSDPLEASGTPIPSTSSYIPSPFKRCLFWPKESTVPKKRRSKEKISSVISSPQWQEYHQKKLNLKKQKDEEKQKRLAARLKKRQEKEDEKCKKAARRLFTSSRKTKESEDSDASSNDEAGSLKSSSGGEWDEKSSGSSDNELQAPRKEVGEYVAVRYENKIFPGRIIVVKEDGVVVTAMVRHGRLWKWP